MKNFGTWTKTHRRIALVFGIPVILIGLILLGIWEGAKAIKKSLVEEVLPAYSVAWKFAGEHHDESEFQRALADSKKEAEDMWNH